MCRVKKALILLGGSGSELLPLTVHTPKPLLPIGNLPLLLFQLQRLKDAGITEIVLSLAYLPRKIRKVVDDGSRFGLLVRYRVEDHPMGTAGAYRLSKNILDGTTVVLNGDVLAEHPVDELVAWHREQGAMVTIGTCRVTNPQSYGVVEAGPGGDVKRFIERPRGKQVRTNRINAGLYVIEPAILDYIPADESSFFETDVFPKLLQGEDGLLRAVDIGQDWLEITRPANYLQSNMDFLDGRIAPPRFAAYKRAHHPPRNRSVEVDDPTRIDAKCIIKKDVRIRRSVIGPGCRIEEGATIADSVLWPGCRIQKGAVVSKTVLGRGCQIGEKARLGEGNILGDKSQIAAHSRI